MSRLEDLNPKNYSWSRLSDNSRLFLVTIYAILFSFIISIGFQNMGVSQIIYRNIFLSAIGVTSLYIAYKKYFVKHKNSVQTYVSHSPEEDSKIRHIDIHVVNQGQNPVTLMHVPVLLLDINQEEIKITYDLMRSTKPISSASKEDKEVKKYESYYYKVFRPYMKDKFGDPMRSQISGIPEKITIDHLNLGKKPNQDVNKKEILELAEEISRRLEVKISQKAISHNSMTWKLSLDNFNKLSTSQIVEKLMSDRVIHGKTSLDDMIYQELTLQDIQEWVPVDEEEEEDEEDDEEEGYENYMMIHIKDHVPEFMGVELEQYGPFNQGDVVKVPDDNAEILINRNNAEKVE